MIVRLLLKIRSCWYIMKRLSDIIKHAFDDEDNRLLMASSPIFIMHLLALGVLFTGFSWTAVVALAVTYVERIGI